MSSSRFASACSASTSVGRDRVEDLDVAGLQVVEPGRGVSDDLVRDLVEVDVAGVVVVGVLDHLDVVLRHPVENLNGPTQTGLVPKFASPADWSAVGDMIMPARSASCAISGANGCVERESHRGRIGDRDAR